MDETRLWEEPHLLISPAHNQQVLHPNQSKYTSLSQSKHCPNTWKKQGGISIAIAICIRLSLSTQIKKIQVNPMNRLLFLEVLLYDLVNRLVFP